MNKHCHILLLVITLIFVIACKPDDPINDDNNVDGGFNSKFTLTTDDSTLTVIHEGDHISLPQPTVLKIKGPLSAGDDSIRYQLIVGLGKLYAIGDTIYNSLYVSFIKRFNRANLSGDSLSEDQFRNWISKGSFEYSADGDVDDGVGITWYDNRGVEWSSGKDIRFSITYPDSTASQTNSYFNLLSAIKSTPSKSFYDFTQQVNIDASCMLYNENMDSLKINSLLFETLVEFVNTP